MKSLGDTTLVGDEADNMLTMGDATMGLHLTKKQQRAFINVHGVGSGGVLEFEPQVRLSASFPLWQSSRMVMNCCGVQEPTGLFFPHLAWFCAIFGSGIAALLPGSPLGLFRVFPPRARCVGSWCPSWALQMFICKGEFIRCQVCESTSKLLAKVAKIDFSHSIPLSRRPSDDAMFVTLQVVDFGTLLVGNEVSRVIKLINNSDSTMFFHMQSNMPNNIKFQDGHGVLPAYRCAAIIISPLSPQP